MPMMKKNIFQIKAIAQKLIEKKELKNLKGGDSSSIIVDDYLGA